VSTESIYSAIVPRLARSQGEQAAHQSLGSKTAVARDGTANSSGRRRFPLSPWRAVKSPVSAGWACGRQASPTSALSAPSARARTPRSVLTVSPQAADLLAWHPPGRPAGPAQLRPGLRPAAPAPDPGRISGVSHVPLR